MKQENKNLFIQAIGKFLLGVVILGLLIFFPAGSLSYWQGWLFMAILFVPMFAAGLVMMARNPELLRKRLHAKEEEKEQKFVVTSSALLFMGAFLGIIHKIKRGVGIGIYAFILTHTIIWIETGPTDIMIWFLYLIGLIYILIVLFKKNTGSNEN